MTGNDLHAWRRERRLKQADLANMLGVSRQTLINWELGKHRLPIDLPQQLERLAYTMAPKAPLGPPDLITLKTASYWPQFRLYGNDYDPKAWGSEHPYVLGFPAQGPQGKDAYPSSLLSTPAYLEAVERARAKQAEAMVKRAKSTERAEAAAAQARIDRGVEREGDEALAAKLQELIAPPAEWPFEARLWALMPQPARRKWCRDNGVPMQD